MEMIKVVYYERDYEETWYLEEQQQSYHIEEDTVEIPISVLTEYYAAVAKLDELEDYFDNNRCESWNKQRAQETARIKKEKAYREEMQAIALESSLSDRGYVKAQEEIKRLSDVN